MTDKRASQPGNFKRNPRTNDIVHAVVPPRRGSVPTAAVAIHCMGLKLPGGANLSGVACVLDTSSKVGGSRLFPNRSSAF